MFTVLALLLWCGAAVKALQAFRAPDDRPLVTIAGGLLAASMAFTVGQDPIDGWLNAVATGLPSLAENIAMPAAYYAILSFFVHTTQIRGVAVSRLRRHGGILGILLLFVVVLWLLCPPEARIDPHSSPVTPARAFLMVSALAAMYPSAAALGYALHYSHKTRRPRLRFGLHVLSVGLAGSVVTNGLSVIMAIEPPPADPSLVTPFLIVGVITVVGLVVGLASPILAAMVAATPTWRQHWQDYRDLRPLWRQIHQAWPTLQLHRTWGSVRPWSVHTLRYRRACEIRDGLIWLAPYYPVLTAAGGPIADYASLSMDEHAALLNEALEDRAASKTDGSEPIGGPLRSPIPQPTDSSDLDADIAWLVELSRALVRHQQGRQSAP